MIKAEVVKAENIEDNDSSGFEEKWEEQRKPVDDEDSDSENDEDYVPENESEGIYSKGSDNESSSSDNSDSDESDYEDCAELLKSANKREIHEDDTNRSQSDTDNNKRRKVME